MGVLEYLVGHGVVGVLAVFFWQLLDGSVAEEGSGVYNLWVSFIFSGNQPVRRAVSSCPGTDTTP